MSLHRHATRRDASEQPVKRALENLGWTVQGLSIPGGPDLLAGKQGRDVLIECKTGRVKVRANQIAWHRWWKGSPVWVVRTAEAAVELDRRFTEGDV